MKETCSSCYSCGMPLEKATDYALGDMSQKYCIYCTDTQGNLKSFEEILNGLTHHLVHSQGLASKAATEMAQKLLAEQPAWKNHPKKGGTNVQG